MTKPVKVETDELLPTRWTLVERLKNWDDQKSWREFFDHYWRLIYGVALKAGLTETEAQEVVQETVVAVATGIKQFKADPARGSFKGWLLNTTRWKIADQFRGRLPAVELASLDANTRTDTLDQLADPAGHALEVLWQNEWEHNLQQVALEKVK